jgi:hypothetical protein
MHDKSVWLFDLHNIFKLRDGLTSEQSYRRIIDNISDIDEMFDEGEKPQKVYESYWN